MSTKRIHDALDWVRQQAIASPLLQPLVEAAAEELKAIEKVARDLTRLNLGDYTYDVRDQRDSKRDPPGDESGWDHPDVKAWSNASGLLDRIAKETRK